MEHKGTRRLETERLILRPFRVTDAEDMFRNWASDPAVTAYLTWPTHESAAASRAVAALWESESQKPEVYQWAIELRSIGQVIGSISVVGIKESVGEAELGYCIGRRWWGQGITAEAVKAVIRYLVRDVGFMRICADHDIVNPNSGRVMQKAGMTREGVLRRAGKNNRGIVDVVQYSILAEEV